jgi:adenylosuccinate synthase
LKGWNCSLAGITKNDIPKELNDYVAYLENALEVPITVISIGPDRTKTILK